MDVSPSAVPPIAAYLTGEQATPNAISIPIYARYVAFGNTYPPTSLCTVRGNLQTREGIVTAIAASQ